MRSCNYVFKDLSDALTFANRYRQVYFVPSTPYMSRTRLLHQSSPRRCYSPHAKCYVITHIDKYTRNRLVSTRTGVRRNDLLLRKKRVKNLEIARKSPTIKSSVAIATIKHSYRRTLHERPTGSTGDAARICAAPKVSKRRMRTYVYAWVCSRYRELRAPIVPYRRPCYSSNHNAAIPKFPFLFFL